MRRSSSCSFIPKTALVSITAGSSCARARNGGCDWRRSCVRRHFCHDVFAGMAGSNGHQQKVASTNISAPTVAPMPAAELAQTQAVTGPPTPQAKLIDEQRPLLNSSMGKFWTLTSKRRHLDHERMHIRAAIDLSPLTRPNLILKIIMQPIGEH